MAKMLSRSLTIVLAAFLSSAAIPALAHANHSWGGYHWARTSNSFTLKLGDNVSSAWDSYLDTTSSDWTVSSVLNTTIVPGGASNPKNCKPASGRVEVCATTYGNNGWLGLAQIWISGLHITQGVTKLNNTYFNTAKYNTPAWKNLVMCQEVGHTLGLDHQDEDFNNPPLGTCMDYTSDPTPNQHPNTHDYEELGIIYWHLDTTTTVSKMPAAANDIDFDAPAQLGTAQWGRLVRSTNHGRTEVYELNLGRGRKVLTHVIWAEPEEE